MCCIIKLYMKNYKRNGYTLAEILIVVSIIAALASIPVIYLFGSRDKASDTKIIAEIETIRRHLEHYYDEHENYPVVSKNLGFLPDEQFCKPLSDIQGVLFNASEQDKYNYKLENDTTPVFQYSILDPFDLNGRIIKPPQKYIIRAWVENEKNKKTIDTTDLSIDQRSMCNCVRSQEFDGKKYYPHCVGRIYSER